MREVGARDDQCVLVTPDALEHGRDLRGGRVAGDDRQQVEFSEQHLEKRQLHLEAVLVRMRLIRGHDVRNREELAAHDRVDRRRTERGGKRRGSWHGEAAERHEVARPNDHHPLDSADSITESAVSRTGHRAGIDVARVRGNQGLRSALLVRRSRSSGAGQAVDDHGAQPPRIPRIERAGDRRGANADTLRCASHGESIDPGEREHNCAVDEPTDSAALTPARGLGLDTRYWHVLDDGRVQCDVCPRGCKLHDGQRGLCFVRGAEEGRIKLFSYGRSSGFCVDPIEKKPLHHFLPGTSVLSFGTAGCNLACKFCFAPDTLVATAHGMRRIADLFEGCEEKISHEGGRTGLPASLRVWTRQVKQARVDKVFAHHYCGELLSLKAACCPPILVTPNHQMFAADRSNLDEVRLIAAAELSTDHYLVIPKRRAGCKMRIDVVGLLGGLGCRTHTARRGRVPLEHLSEVLRSTGTSAQLAERLGYHPAYVRLLRGRLARGVLRTERPHAVCLQVSDGRVKFSRERGPGVPENLQLTPDLAWLLGFYCAEGSIGEHPRRPNSYQLVFSCGHHEAHLVARTARLLREIFSTPVTIVNRRTTTTVEMRSTSPARLFEALCGRGASNKRVPAELPNASPIVIRAFLDGYFAGDGHFSQTHIVGGTVSADLALGVYELGLHLDLLPTFFVHEPTPTKLLETRVVSQSTTYIVKFRRDRYEGPRRQERTLWRDAGEVFLVPLRHSERVPYDGTVYNLEVDDPDHSYLAPFVAVSNCQNWDMSKSREMDTLADSASPEGLADAATRLGCASVAFTYNDPVVFMEYAIDTAEACRARGIKSVAVTAGYMCAEPRAEFYRHMDAANVDLKAFSERFYYKVCGGSLAPVLETLEFLKHETRVWFEITTLLIPGENDSNGELDRLTRWIAERLGPDVPLHFTAFHPDWKMLDKPRTPAATLVRARQIALANGLRYVYTGNVHDREGGSTCCPRCDTRLIERDWYELGEWRLTDTGACSSCGTRIPGVFAGPPGHWGARRLGLRLGARAATRR
jgi:pyruvate formate lyase activating enzyme